MKTKYRNFEGIDTQKPFLIKGEDAWRLYEDIQKDDKSFQGDGLGHISYLGSSKELVGSNPLRSGQINRILANSGLRVAVPGDDINGEVYNSIRKAFLHTDFNALNVYESSPNLFGGSYLPLWKSVTELAEEKQGRVKFPFMIQGFYIIPDGKHEKIIPASNFKIIEDERLSEKYNEWRFDHVDNVGIPSDLSKTNGKRIFYTTMYGNRGLSRFFMDSDSNLSLRDRDLFFSVLPSVGYFSPIGTGRMVLVKDPKISEVENQEKKGNENLEKILKLNNF